MSNLFNSLSECLGFSQTMKLTAFKTFFALRLISSRLPMGVDTIYNPFVRFSIILIFIFIVSCAPVNNQISQKVSTNNYPISQKVLTTNYPIQTNEVPINIFPGIAFAISKCSSSLASKYKLILRLILLISFL